MKTTKLLAAFFRFGIFAMQILSLISMGYHLASHEVSWAINYLGNFLLWTLVLMLSLQRDRYFEWLIEALDLLEELNKAKEDMILKELSKIKEEMNEIKE